MMSITGPSLASPRRKPLAAGLAAACGAMAPALAGLCMTLALPALAAGAPARAFDMHALTAGTAAGVSRIRSTMSERPSAVVTGVVTPSLVASAVLSCGDDPNDFTTLRHAVLTANAGDTIDLTALPCSRITLQNGAIAVIVDDLKLLGPGASALAIDGNHADRVFKHTGTGKLTLSGLTVTNGTLSADKAYGGCIYGKGSLELDSAALTGCKALGQSAAVGGGAVVFGAIALDHATIADNLADAAVGAGAKNTSAIGGGAVALSQTDDSLLVHSRVSGNVVSSPSGLAEGGGLVAAQLSAKYCTFSGNQANGAGVQENYGAAAGFITLYSLFLANSTVDHNAADIAGGMFLANDGFATIVQSTVSSNDGRLAVGGIAADVAVSIANSTIAFNTGGVYGGGGLLIGGSYAATLQSNIIADNVPTDLDGGSSTITGTNNLVKVAGANVTLPAGTLIQDPQLGPLAFNGGARRTHALSAGSPAIDAGNNPVNFGADQRGAPNARVVGAAADIGAFEYDPDRLFADPFDD